MSNHQPVFPSVVGDRSCSGAMVTDIPIHSIPPRRPAAEIIQDIEHELAGGVQAGLSSEDVIEIIAQGRQERDDRALGV